MNFCDKCKKVFSDNDTVCSVCGSTLSTLNDEETPVYLTEAFGFEKDRIMATLNEADIPYSQYYKDKMPEQMSGDDYSACILVPLKSYNKALEVCKGIGAIDEDVQPLDFVDKTNEVIDYKEENRNAAKRTTIKILSMLAFLALVALAVFGTDFVTNLIKGLFK